MSIRVDDEKRKKLKAIASLKGKSMRSVIEALIKQDIEDFKEKNEMDDELTTIMKVSESSFDEWDNDEDKIYDEL